MFFRKSWRRNPDGKTRTKDVSAVPANRIVYMVSRKIP
jgi:hypothetical protein